tara:strand:- start:72 stop:374 length:303 start_codon:yes stop_codon:yes gene_type:complete
MNPEPIFMSRRDKVLHEANQLISQDRNKQYGDPHTNMLMISRAWSEVLDHTVQTWQVPVMLAQMKLARISSGGYKEDSIVDAIGYLALASEIKDKEVSKL